MQSSANVDASFAARELWAATRSSLRIRGELARRDAHALARQAALGLAAAVLLLTGWWIALAAAALALEPWWPAWLSALIGAALQLLVGGWLGFRAHRGLRATHRQMEEP